MLRSAFSTSPHREISRKPPFHPSSIDNDFNRMSNGNSFDERPIVGRQFYPGERSDDRSRQRTPSEGFQTQRFQVSPSNFHVSPIEERTPVKTRPTSSHSFPSDLNNILQQASNNRQLHKENEIIFANDFPQKSFQPPATRKVAKIASKENYSLSNGKARSSSATPITVTEIKEPEAPRPKSIRRHQAVTHAGAGLITTESWKTDPVKHKTVLKNKSVAKPDAKLLSEKKPERKVSPSRQMEIVEKTAKPKVPTVLDPNVEKKKVKSQKSQPKPEPQKEKQQKTPPMTEAEKLKLAEYITAKRLKREEQINEQKRLKIEEEKKRREKLKKLSEQTKKAAQQPLPEHLIRKRTASARSANGNSSAERHQRMLELMGPNIVPETPREQHTNTPFEEPMEIRERSSSRSSSSSESVVEVQSAKPDRPASTVVLGLEVPVAPVEERQHKILRWAMSLARDCNVIEDKIKFSRPDGTQRFDVVAPTHQRLQSDEGNLRLQPPIEFVHREIPKEKKPNPKILRPSGRLSRLNQNQTSEYQGKDLPGIGNLRDPMLEQLIHRDRAASKIQALYRGYTVRKSLNWARDQEQKPAKSRPKNKTPVRQRNLFETPPGQLDLRLSDDRFTIGSTFLRAFQRSGAQLVSDAPAERSPEKVPSKPITGTSYSDDYENPTSTVSSTPQRSKPAADVTQPSVTVPRTPVQKDRRPIPSSSSSSTLSSSSSTTITPRPTPEPRSNDRRRSISPPLTPTMSPDLGRPIHQHPTIPISAALLVNNRPSQNFTDERRYSPNALERQLNAELHLLDGVDASMKQLENMERLRSITLAQQEVVSLAQILKNKNDSQPMATGSRRKSPIRSVTSSDSSSSTSLRDHRSKKPRPASPSSQSSIEPAVVQREKSRQQNQPDLKSYEDRLKNLENKIRLLNNRAHQIHAEERKAASMKSSHDSSISEDLPVSHRSSSSTISTIQRKTNDDTSEIRTEILEKIPEPSSVSFLQSSDVITSDSSDREQRIKNAESELKAKKEQIKKLKQERKKVLLEQEEKMKEELKKCDDELKKLRTPSRSTKVPEKQSAAIVPRKTPPKVLSDSSTSSSSTTPRKNDQSSIAEELPDPNSASQSKSTPLKSIGKSPRKKERDFFDDDDDDDEHEKPVKKIVEPTKPLETPRDERDTQHDALSLSISTDLAASSETENESRRPSSDLGKPILNFKTNISPSPERSKNSSSSSSSESSPSKSTANEKLPSKTKRLSSSSSEQKLSAHGDDYDEDFSDLSHSPSAPKKDPVAPIDVESVQEDLDEKKSSDGTNETSSRKSSDDQQSEILVFGRKSAANTPRNPIDDETPKIVPPAVEKSQESFLQNDDTSLDVSGSDEENQDEIEREKRIDLITDQFLRSFIDEAIDQGQQIDRIKKETPSNKKISMARAAQEWLSDESSSSSDQGAAERKPISIPVQDERDFPTTDAIELPVEIEQSGFQIDLSRLDEKNTDEPLVPSPRKIIVEEPVKLLVPHSPEEVKTLCQRACDILFDQNQDFTDRTTIRSEIPEEFFLLNDENEDEQDEELRMNRKAYSKMIFDLSLNLIHEISADRISNVRYPQWQQSKWTSKRFSMAQPPKTRQEIEDFVSKTVLELLQLNTRPIVQPKFRVSNHRRAGAERFEAVLDEEIRRTESQWLQYDEDRIQAQFAVADSIFEQVFDEIVAGCVSIIQQRALPNSSSTRL